MDAEKADERLSSSDSDKLPKDDTPEPMAAPPNGGRAAWLQVAGAFFLFFNSWGIVNTFGVFQSYYADVLLATDSASSIAWIGTIQGFLLLLGGLFVGPLYDKGYLTSLLLAGTLLVVVGLMMTSLASTYYQVLLAHGLAVGLGCAFLFLPSVAVVATYFSTRRSVALGITAAGGSIGSVIYPILFHRLLDRLGFGWTTRILGFIALATLAFALAVLRRRVPPPAQARPLMDTTAFHDAPFVLFSLGLFLSFVGLYFPIFYLPSYFTASLHNDGPLSVYVLAILNAASISGRIMPGLLADRIGPLNTYVPICAMATVLAFAWIGIRNTAGTVVFAVLYGFVSGAAVSLPPTILAHLTADQCLLGTRMGMCFTVAGLGLLIGNPIAGTLLDLEHAVFWKAQLFCASMVVASTVLALVVRILAGRRVAGWKT